MLVVENPAASLLDDCYDPGMCTCSADFALRPAFRAPSNASCLAEVRRWRVLQKKAPDANAITRHRATPACLPACVLACLRGFVLLWGESNVNAVAGKLASVMTRTALKKMKKHQPIAWRLVMLGG